MARWISDERLKAILADQADSAEKVEVARMAEEILEDRRLILELMDPVNATGLKEQIALILPQHREPGADGVGSPDL